MAMSPALLTQLPRELIGLIFDALDILHIVRVSHVCTLCRLIAHAHPTFWRDVDLDGVERCDLQLFIYRICSTIKSGLRLNIAVFHVYTEDSEAEPLRTVVLPAIRQHLFRTAYLRLYICPDLNIHSMTGIGDCERFYTVFRQAPALLSLDLDIHGYTERGIDIQLLFQHVPHLLSIPTIEFVRSHPVANLLASRLPGPLGIELVAMSVDIARYTVFSHSRGWRRTFAIHSDRDFGWPHPRFYASEDIGCRVTTLALDASLASVAHLIGELAACETLQLAQDCALDVKPTKRLLLPALKQIVVRSTSPLYVAIAAAALGHFLEELVGRMTAPISLQMDGVVLRGDLECLGDYLLTATGHR